jgi:hypothetical protein
MLMKDKFTPLIVGLLLIALGGLFLLGNLGFLGSVATAIWVLLFAVAGVAFLYVFVADRGRWWAIIPGFSLLGLASLIGLQAMLPRLGDLVGAPIFLASIGLAFWAVYFVRREFWWAIIPGGVMLSVASLVFVEGFNPPFDTGGIILLGIGVTFAIVAMVDTKQGRMRWAWIPAGVMGFLGVLILAQSVAALRYLWPLFIIGAGLFFVGRGWLGARKGDAAQASDTQGTADESTQPSGKPGTRELGNPWDAESDEA